MSKVNSLLLDRSTHLHLTHQLNVLELVFLGDLGVYSICFQFANFSDAKLLHLKAECQIIAERVDRIFDEIGETLIEGIVLTLHIGVFHLNAENVLVERAREVTF